MDQRPIYRRRIEISARQSESEGIVRVALEDDFHHFRLALRHDKRYITDIDGQSPRIPYSLCPVAAGQLQDLVGIPLSTVPQAVMGATDTRNQCTHLLDMAGLAMAAAMRGTTWQSYDVEVPARQNNHTTARLWRDGELLLDWDMDHLTIRGPSPFAGQNVKQGFGRWAVSMLAEDFAEAALVLRRCVIISLGRTRNLDAESSASPTGKCYVQQPTRAGDARRVVGSTLDFTDGRDRLCADDRSWLAFEDGSDDEPIPKAGSGTGFR